MPSPFDFLNSINQGKNNLLEEDPQNIKDYSPFIINKGLSYFLDTVMFANEINIRSTLDKDMQYRFYLGSISKAKRFKKWEKKDVQENIDLIKQSYLVNDRKASEYLKILTEEQIEILKERQNKGGMSK